MKFETKQDAFDFAVRHMYKQKSRSMLEEATSSSTGVCGYRGKEGKMCIIGAMIDDEHYDSAFEGLGVQGGAAEAMVKSGINLEIFKDNRSEYWWAKHSFLSDLQDCHDLWGNGEDMKDLKKIFMNFAEDWDLTTGVFHELGWN